jgi:hypothetical protein
MEAMLLNSLICLTKIHTPCHIKIAHKPRMDKLNNAQIIILLSIRPMLLSNIVFTLVIIVQLIRLLALLQS